MTVEPTANGNAGSAASYDIENRPTCVTPYSYAIGYAPDDKRIWEGAAYTAGSDTYSEDPFTLYGLDGQRVGIYRIRNRMSPPDTINMRFVTMEENVWVGKKLLKTRKFTTTEVVLQDRLGSVLFRYNANTDTRKAYAYYPYGQSRGSSTPNAEEGFGTYTRLDNNENHYADQRYYNANNGRFHQPDPYQASGGPTDPASWNRYAYVEGDPVNFDDASGLARQVAAPLDGPYSITVTATMPGIPLIDIFGPRRDPAFLGGWSFIPLSLERELRCERASEPELTNPELEEFLGGVEMEAEEMAELYELPNGKPDGQNDAVPAFVYAAATAANWVVYWARTPQGQYYIGVTSQFAQRQAAHAAQGLRIAQVEGIQALNYAAAKGVEQNLIEGFRRNSAQLLNKINSISPNNRFYQQFTGMGHQVLRDCRAKLPEGFPWP